MSSYIFFIYLFVWKVISWRKIPIIAVAIDHCGKFGFFQAIYTYLKCIFLREFWLFTNPAVSMDFSRTKSLCVHPGYKLSSYQIGSVILQFSEVFLPREISVSTYLAETINFSSIKVAYLLINLFWYNLSLFWIPAKSILYSCDVKENIPRMNFCFLLILEYGFRDKKSPMW